MRAVDAMRRSRSDKMYRCYCDNNDLRPEGKQLFEILSAGNALQSGRSGINVRVLAVEARASARETNNNNNKKQKRHARSRKICHKAAQ